MKRRTKIITATVLALGIAGGAAAVGKHKYSDPEKRADHAMSFISSKLELDQTQVQSLEALKEQLMAARSTMHGDTESHKAELKALLAADTFDQARALELLNSKTNQVNTSAPEVLAALGNFLDGLNAEQKGEILDAMERKGKRGGHFGHH